MKPRRLIDFLLVAAAIVVLPVGWACAEQASPADHNDAGYRSFYADRQAFKEGDMLTVVIVESAAATSRARTQTDKSDQVAATATRFGGIGRGFSVGANNQFNGGGEIQRAEQLLGKLTVKVESVDANGNLHVSGEQLILINNEQQRIAVHGALRPADIAPDNTVPSWRIMDAKIEFKGKGILARKQSPGLLAKLFDLFGFN
ncbi:MAG TPA: flagellar basal body L-ring protein FlgH [Steroidobacteraceae bacterium]|nr:flagellar basal body L-ring protein FlgH [Steroidobacteraceae bacterium]